MGHSTEESAKPQSPTPYRQPSLPSCVPTLHHKDPAAPEQGWGTPNFVPGDSIRQHIQPESSEPGNAMWLLLGRGSTEGPSQRRTGKWDDGSSLYQYLFSMSNNYFFSFPFAAFMNALSAVCRQQGAPQRAREVRRQTSRRWSNSPQVPRHEERQPACALRTSTRVLLLSEHCPIFTSLPGSHKHFPAQWGIPASIWTL